MADSHRLALCALGCGHACDVHGVYALVLYRLHRLAPAAARGLVQGGVVTQQPLFPETAPQCGRAMSAAEDMLLRAYERIEAGLTDSSGRVNPDGARMTLTPVQRHILEGFRDCLQRGALTRPCAPAPAALPYASGELAREASRG